MHIKMVKWTSAAAPGAPTTHWAVGGQKVLKLRLLASRPRVRGAIVCPRNIFKRWKKLRDVEFSLETRNGWMWFGASLFCCPCIFLLCWPSTCTTAPFETQIGHLSKLTGPIFGRLRAKKGGLKIFSALTRRKDTPSGCPKTLGTQTLNLWIDL